MSCARKVYNPGPVEHLRWAASVLAATWQVLPAGSQPRHTSFSVYPMESICPVCKKSYDGVVCPKCTVTDLDVTGLMASEGLQVQNSEDSGAGATAFLVDLVSNRKIPITTPRCKVGRDDLNDIVISGDQSISRFHFVITCENGQYSVQDGKSRHGTFLNGNQITISEPIHDGDVLKVGVSLFWFVIEAAVPGTGGSDKFAPVDIENIDRQELEFVIPEPAQTTQAPAAAAKDEKVREEKFSRTNEMPAIKMPEKDASKVDSPKSDWKPESKESKDSKEAKDSKDAKEAVDARGEQPEPKADNGPVAKDKPSDGLSKAARDAFNRPAFGGETMEINLMAEPPDISPDMNLFKKPSKKDSLMRDDDEDTSFAGSYQMSLDMLLDPLNDQKAEDEKDKSGQEKPASSEETDFKRAALEAEAALNAELAKPVQEDEASKPEADAPKSEAEPANPESEAPKSASESETPQAESDSAPKSDDADQSKADLKEEEVSRDGDSDSKPEDADSKEIESKKDGEQSKDQRQEDKAEPAESKISELEPVSKDSEADSLLKSSSFNEGDWRAEDYQAKSSFGEINYSFGISESDVARAAGQLSEPLAQAKEAEQADGPSAGTLEKFAEIIGEAEASEEKKSTPEPQSLSSILNFQSSPEMVEVEEPKSDDDAKEPEVSSSTNDEQPTSNGAKSVMSIVKESSSSTVPDWCKKYFSAELNHLNKELGELSEQVRLAQQKIKEVESRVALTKGLRNTLLTAQGEDLVEACGKVLTMLGFKANLSEEDKHELKLEMDDKNVSIARIVWTDTQADRTHLGQLSISQTRYWCEKGIEPKGILIISKSGGDAPSPLSSSDYNGELAEYAGKKNVCLMTTLQLLAVYKEVALNEGSSESVKNTINNCNGWLPGYNLEPGSESADRDEPSGGTNKLSSLLSA